MDSKQYLELVKQRKAEKIKDETNLIALDMPSGATFLLLPVSVGQYAVSGRLPLNLLAKLRSAKNSQSKELSPAELEKFGLNALEMVRDVMLNNLVFPKISLTDEPDSIAPEDIDPEDFEYFKNWLLAGAQAVQKKT